MKKLLLASMFLGALLFLSACKITLNGEDIQLGNPVNEIVKADDNHTDNEEAEPDDPTVLKEENDKEKDDDVQNEEKEIIDSCGNDLTALYQILPDKFPIPDCAQIDRDGSDYSELGGKRYHVFHYTADKFSSKSVYNLTKDFFLNGGYEITEDRVEEDFHFALLYANLGKYEFLWDTRDIGTEDGDRSVAGFQLIIDLK